jgi:20S proteasome subunit alpha 3
MEEGDALTNTFSEEGRIHQVEFAIKNVGSAGSSVGIKFRDGVVLMGRTLSPAFSLMNDEKIFRVNEKVFALVAGLYADSNVLVNYARVKAQNYLFDNGVEMSPQIVAHTLALIKQGFTQGGGMRPFGVSFMVCGHDGKRFRLFSTDPSGTVSEWNAHAFGENEKAISASLEGGMGVEKELSEEEALSLLFKSIASASEISIKDVSKALEVVVVREANQRVYSERVSGERIREGLERGRSK